MATCVCVCLFLRLEDCARFSLASGDSRRPHVQVASSRDAARSESGGLQRALRARSRGVEVPTRIAGRKFRGNKLRTE